MKGDRMIIIQGFVQLAPGEIERFRPAGIEMIAETSKEAGCIAYSFANDIADPNKVHIIERWESEEALARHFETPHMRKFNGALATAKILKADAKIYSGEQVRPLLG
jgi:quinol monooxygenase YgiN